ncbi:6,7-dimethyl-8-ribityllumazine synthase [Marinoscillum furvescens]|uniref:6,7-dimethyl-8-ribityllumazine synthase n=1 Tax=Marinoscillum furvescens DSM 4134 TaxID=1122208 RepID=A0A3D9L4J8_MARFU|nr:6,7-dimethyl-8-ribityllumazine synthase [Marinoscillum furvescens]RED98867.1 6,7-dimethyl-8-ribityllumazine synthase [Marinoscillum furvescens DSM 4134]
MATSLKNLSDTNVKGIKDVSGFKFGIVVAEWNEEVTEALYSGAFETLLQLGATRENIERMNVPGSFELTLGAQWMAKREDIDAVITLGCVIQGETRHFDFICQACAQGITDVGLKYDKPVVFGVLTPDTQKQAMDRAGGKHGNKGDEAAATAVKMLSVKPV